MCELGEQVLSDVHVHIPPSSRLLDGGGHATTRFYFAMPKLAHVHLSPQTGAEENVGPSDADQVSVSRRPVTPGDNDADEPVTMATVDEDGDLLVIRKKRHHSENVILIDHAMATTLNNVGLQVWQGCLLLCDFLLTNREMFRDQVALEMGAGVGLASIVTAMTASFVFCTDVGKSVLEMCQRNISNNFHQILDCPDTSRSEPVVQVRELDWRQSGMITDCSSPFRWSDDDMKTLGEVTVIIAADVVYDDNLTDAFFTMLTRLMTTGKDKTAFIALEKRLNFTTDDLAVTCKAYDHYCWHIAKLASSQDTGDGVKYSVERLPVDFPQCFHYMRTEQLELWKISAVRQNTPPD